MKSNYKALGRYIQPVVGRNNDLDDLPLMGLSISKKFIPSIANTIGTDMSTYRIIEKNQFAYGPVTSRNGDKITIALFNDYEKALISQAYIPFEVKDTNELEPEYLMMWFRRPEFDRYARFMSHGSAREIFGWDDMCNTLLPIPNIAKQREIVAEYNTIQNRIKLNALVHRTYMGAHIQMRVFDDRLSIWNEGGLPFGLSVEELKGEHNSRPRNPKIAKACFMAGYIDTWGRGTLKIINACKLAGMPEPDILEKDGGVSVTLFKDEDSVAASGQSSGQTGGPISGPIGGPIGGPISGPIDDIIDNVTDRQKEILQIIEGNNKISKRKLAAQLNINVSAAQNHLDLLKEKGLIKREDGTRGFWKILYKK